MRQRVPLAGGEEREGLALRTLRLLLVCLPRPFRQEIGEEIIAFHRQRLREEGGLKRRRLSIWLAGAVDLVLCGLRERMPSAESLATLLEESWRRRRARSEAATILHDWLEIAMETIRDLRYVLRSLTRTPGFVVAFVLTLGLGMGANTAIFSAVRGVLLEPLPHRDGERLVYLRHAAPLAGVENVTFSVPEIADYRDRATTLDGVAEYSAMTFTLLGLDEPRRVRAGVVSGNFFAVLGLHPAAGRLLDEGDDGDDAAPAVVLTHRYSALLFGGDPSVVGRRVTINGRTATIVGVLEAAPQFPERTDVYVNMVTSPHHLSASMHHDRSHRMTEVFARLAPDATVADAQAEVETIAAALHDEYPESYEEAAGHTVHVTSLKAELTRGARPTLLVLMAIAGFVLLVACANVANLTLARTLRRGGELGLRAALGASAARLRRMLFLESLVLTLAGAVLGLLLAVAGFDLLVGFAGRFSVRAAEIRLDGGVFLFGLLLAVLTAVALAFTPGLGGLVGRWTFAGPSLRTTGSLGRVRLQRALVAAEIGIAFVVLVGSGLLLRTLLNLGRVDPGFAETSVLTMDIPPTPQPAEERLSSYRTLVDRVAALPGVRSAALASVVPLRDEPSTLSSRLEVRAEGHPPHADAPTPRADFRIVSPGYFDTLEIGLLAGRQFDDGDDLESPLVVILNRRAAELLFPDVEAVGRRIAWQGEQLRFAGISTEWRRVVGVVEDTLDYGIEDGIWPVVYQPFAQEVGTRALVVRAAGDPASLVPPIVSVVRQMRADQPIEDIRTLEQIHADTLSPQRLNTTLVALFAALSLVIVSVGVWGVLAFSVTQRRREFGIRQSLGADRRAVMRQVLGESGRLLGVGLVLGAVAAVAFSQLLGGLLYDVAPTDPQTFLAVAALLAAVALGSALAPARRAAGIEPATALRDD